MKTNQPKTKTMNFEEQLLNDFINQISQASETKNREAVARFLTDFEPLNQLSIDGSETRNALMKEKKNVIISLYQATRRMSEHRKDQLEKLEATRAEDIRTALKKYDWFLTDGDDISEEESSESVDHYLKNYEEDFEFDNAKNRSAEDVAMLIRYDEHLVETVEDYRSDSFKSVINFLNDDEAKEDSTERLKREANEMFEALKNMNAKTDCTCRACEMIRAGALKKTETDCPDSTK